jgi:dipeptidyl-peptidase 4
VTEIWRDHRDTRVFNDIASAWYGDGVRILLTGDLDDRYRLYLLTPGDAPASGAAPESADGLPPALTHGPFDVAGAGISVASGRDILYVSSEPSPYERHVWRTDDRGETHLRLTTKAGLHTPFVSPDGGMLALLSTDDVTPTELYLADARVPDTARRITWSQPEEFGGHPWTAGRYVSFNHSRDRFAIHARILEPPGLDRHRQHPVIFGPVYSNTVRNRWEPRFGSLQQYLAIEHGYIVVQVDVRGSTGYGRDFRESFLMDWGGRDLDDLESAVDHMRTLPYVDGRRMGIWGTSYGGTLAVYSLLKKPGLFRAGVAAAPATDPHHFGSDDVSICRRPQTHPESFQRGALQYAGNLRDHLLIIHGMQDDVVPFQTSVVLAEELIRLGKDFDFAFAPAATHAWASRPQDALYLMRKIVDHFNRYLRPDTSLDPPHH